MLNQPTNPTRTFHVADVAKEANVTPATIRYYAHTGLIHPRRDPDNGYRYFVEEDVRRIAFIRQAKALGLTINDIKTILDATDRGEECFVEVKSMVERRLAQIRSRITEHDAREAIQHNLQIRRHALVDPAVPAITKSLESKILYFRFDWIS